MTKSEVPYEEAGVADLKGISGKVRLYRVPKVTDASYGPKDLIPAQSAGLPFGGLSLDRVRNKIGPLATAQILAPAVTQAQNVLSKLPGVVQQSAETASRGFSWWKIEVRRSRGVQYGTIILAVLLIISLVWVAKSKPRKQLTPLQKLQRSLRF